MHWARSVARVRTCLFAFGVSFALVLDSSAATAGGSRVLNPVGGGNPRVFPPGSNPFGASYAEWSVRWWQWAYGLPVAGHPLFDETGADCGAGQSGPVWFLGGVFNVSGSATRTECVVPVGRGLYFPVLNVEWDNACPPGDLTIDELRATAADFMNLATDLTAELDGVPIGNLELYRFAAGPFGVDIPSGNIWEFFGCDTPAGHYEPLLADGFFLMLKPLPPGPHTLHFSGTIGDPVNFTLDITYDLTVAGGDASVGVPLEPGVQGPGGLVGTDVPKPVTTWGRMKATYR
jgi:hypothetical protein